MFPLRRSLISLHCSTKWTWSVGQIFGFGWMLLVDFGFGRAESCHKLTQFWFLRTFHCHANGFGVGSPTWSPKYPILNMHSLQCGLQLARITSKSRLALYYCRFGIFISIIIKLLHNRRLFTNSGLGRFPHFEFNVPAIAIATVPAPRRVWISLELSSSPPETERFDIAHTPCAPCLPQSRSSRADLIPFRFLFCLSNS